MVLGLLIVFVVGERLVLDPQLLAQGVHDGLLVLVIADAEADQLVVAKVLKAIACGRRSQPAKEPRRKPC